MYEYQAGIKKITLHENKGISFVYYDSQNDKAITDLKSQGQIIDVLNEQLPTFETAFKISDSGEIVSEYKLSFHLMGYNYDSIGILSLLKTSIYGWCFNIEYYDGTHKFYNTPLKSEESKIEPQQEMSFEIMLETVIDSNISHLDYDPNASTVPIYRADTTLLTADTTIYRADYAL